MADFDRWIEEVKKSRGGWVTVYTEALHTTISDPERFFKALDIYGPDLMFEAIIVSSAKKIEGDPLAYLIAVAHGKMLDRTEETFDDVEYQLRLERTKLATELHNQEMAEKIRKARKLAVE